MFAVKVDLFSIYWYLNLGLRFALGHLAFNLRFYFLLGRILMYGSICLSTSDLGFGF